MVYDDYNKPLETGVDIYPIGDGIYADELRFYEPINSVRMRLPTQ